MGEVQSRDHVVGPSYNRYTSYRFTSISPTLYCPYAWNGPLSRYVKLWVAHTPGMPGTFSSPPASKETTS